MARKINGYARDNYGVIEFVELGKPEEGAWDEATLVVGKERVFTEAEVRAMLSSMRDVAVSQRLGLEQYEDVCKTNGITL